MHVVLEGLHLNTTTYAEADEISFTFFSADDGLGLAVSEALASDDRVLALQRGDEQVSVRAREHEVTPPYSRRLDGAIHCHSVRLELVGAPAASFPVVASPAHRIAAR